MSLEYIARLNPKSISLMATGGGGGMGSGGLTNVEIAGALAGCRHPMGSLMLRAMIAGQSRDELATRWEAHVRRKADVLGWKSQLDRTISLLAHATLDEHMDNRCKSCLGRGIKRKRIGKEAAAQHDNVEPGCYLVVACDQCGGTGKGARTSSMRGRMMGMRPQSFDETWADRYEMLLSELTEIQRDAEDQFKRQLRRR